MPKAAIRKLYARGLSQPFGLAAGGFLCLAAAGCFLRPAKPVAIEERIAPIYPESRPVDCQMAMLTSPPPQPYDVFAHIVSYGNEIDGLESMNALIRDKACEVGADAVVLLPPQQVDHMNMEDSYPDWVQQQKQGQFGRYAQSADRRFSLARRGFAVLFKPEQNAQ